jgi:hypothetical protein
MKFGVLTACMIVGSIAATFTQAKPSLGMRCGYGSNTELLDYSAPDQVGPELRNNYIGGHQLALYFDDPNATKTYFDTKGIRTLLGPFPVDQGPIEGQAVLYFYAPWSSQLGAISYPDGMAYEAGIETALWSVRNPSQ